jgi:hypothetical protein
LLRILLLTKSPRALVETDIDDPRWSIALGPQAVDPRGDGAVDVDFEGIFAGRKTAQEEGPPAVGSGRTPEPFVSRHEEDVGVGYPVAAVQQFALKGAAELESDRNVLDTPPPAESRAAVLDS